MLLETFLLLNSLVYRKFNIISWTAANKRVIIANQYRVTDRDFRSIIERPANSVKILSYEFSKIQHFNQRLGIGHRLDFTR